MELLLEGDHRVDSNDTEALEKAAAALEQEALETTTALDLEKAAEKGELTPEKAKKILKDGEVHGKPLTEQQRKYFGAVAGGTAKKSESVTISSIDELANYGGTLEKAKRSLQAPKEWWDKTIKEVGATPKYKGYKRERLAKIVGDIWAGLDDKKKKEIRGRYGKEFGAAVEKSDDAPGESLEETSTKELIRTLKGLTTMRRDPKKEPALQKRRDAIKAELKRRNGKATKSMTAIEALEEFTKTKKSMDAWINEQETNMTNENTNLTKALGDDAELAKGMMGTSGQRITEWSGQFYDTTGLEVEALQCVKDTIACQKKWDAHHKSAKPWREIEDMPRKEREAYRDKQGKAREAISKEEDAVRMRMRDLEAKLIDYRIKEAKVRKTTMGKSGVETLADFAKGGDAEPAPVEESGTDVLNAYLEKAQGMPTGEPGMSRGTEDGADLSRKTGASGSGDSAGSVIGTPGPGEKKKLSDDDDEVEAQLKGRKKPIERFTGKSMSVPGHQREMVAHENAQVVSRLRKGPDDITLGPGIPAPVVEPEPVRKAQRWVQGEDSLVVYSDGSDERAARLVKGEDFYAGGQAPALGRNPMVLTQRKRCTACEAIMSKSLSVCPHCGDGAGVQKQGALRIAVSAVRNGSGLRPSRGEGDIVIK